MAITWIFQVCRLAKLTHCGGRPRKPTSHCKSLVSSLKSILIHKVGRLKAPMMMTVFRKKSKCALIALPAESWQKFALCTNLNSKLRSAFDLSGVCTNWCSSGTCTNRKLGPVANPPCALSVSLSKTGTYLGWSLLLTISKLPHTMTNQPMKSCFAQKRAVLQFLRCFKFQAVGVAHHTRLQQPGPILNFNRSITNFTLCPPSQQTLFFFC